MNSKNYLNSIVVALLTGILFPALSFAQPQTAEKKRVPEELIVKFKTKVSPVTTLKNGERLAITGIRSIDALNRKYRVKAVNAVFKFRPQNQMLAEKYGLERTFVFKIDHNADKSQVIKEYSANPEVEYIEMNNYCYADIAPNDTSYKGQWGFKNTANAISYVKNLEATVGIEGADINAEPAWNICTGDRNVILAILDSGLDYEHPEFAGRVLKGYDFVNNDDDPMDDNGHGTACAGLSAATGNNNSGIAGVNWECSVLPVKVLDKYAGGSYTTIANGIVFAANNGADVISMSLSTTQNNCTLRDAVEYAYNLGCTIFASRGNRDNPEAVYPSAYKNVISVGGLSPCNSRKTPFTCDGENWWGASYGGGKDKMDFIAPCVRNITTDIRGTKGKGPGDYFYEFNGVSSATAIAAGVGSLLKSHNTALTNDEIRKIMRETSVDIGADGYDEETGFGRLDVFKALTWINTSMPVAKFTADATIITAGDTVFFKDLSLNKPDSWSWKFDGGQPNISSKQHPAVVYNKPGTYKVTLTVSNSEGKDTKIMSGYIRVLSQNICIDSFPYTEGFEKGIGAFVQTEGDDLNWIRKKGATKSKNTGPKMAANGDYYLYTESTGKGEGYPEKTANIITPCFNFHNVEQPVLEFKYHMFGVSMGKLCVQVSTDNGNNWTERWSVFGDHGNKWHSSKLSLKDYAGNENVKIRFSGTTGDGYMSDISIDEVKVYFESAGSAKADEKRKGKHLSENQAVAYPNPVQNSLYIEGNLEIRETDIYNMFGERLLQPGKGQIIDVSELKEGIYFLIINKTQIIKFIKN